MDFGKGKIISKQLIIEGIKFFLTVYRRKSMIEGVVTDAVDWMDLDLGGILAIENETLGCVGVFHCNSMMMKMHEIFRESKLCKGEWFGLIGSANGWKDCKIRILTNEKLTDLRGDYGDGYKGLVEYWKDQYRFNGWTLYNHLTPKDIEIHETVRKVQFGFKLLYYFGSKKDRAQRHYVASFRSKTAESEEWMDKHYPRYKQKEDGTWIRKFSRQGIVYGGVLEDVEYLNLVNRAMLTRRSVDSRGTL